MKWRSALNFRRVFLLHSDKSSFLHLNSLQPSYIWIHSLDGQSKLNICFCYFFYSTLCTVDQFRSENPRVYFLVIHQNFNFQLFLRLFQAILLRSRCSKVPEYIFCSLQTIFFIFTHTLYFIHIISLIQILCWVFFFFHTNSKKVPWMKILTFCCI